VKTKNNNDMKTLTFKTNINCNNCVRSVTPFLDKVSTIKAWNVDTGHPDKILTVEVDEGEAAQVTAALEKAGYHGQPID
jgi:copper chaperone CopZ